MIHTYIIRTHTAPHIVVMLSLLLYTSAILISSTQLYRYILFTSVFTLLICLRICDAARVMSQGVTARVINWRDLDAFLNQTHLSLRPRLQLDSTIHTSDKK